MWRDVPDATDRFPGDFVASLRAAIVAALLLGGLSWWAARSWLQRTYPHHPEMLPAAIVVAVMDGALLGLGAFVLTYVCRVWRYERRLRRASDDALRRDLEAIGGHSHEPQR